MVPDLSRVRKRFRKVRLTSFSGSSPTTWAWRAGFAEWSEPAACEGGTERLRSADPSLKPGLARSPRLAASMAWMSYPEEVRIRGAGSTGVCPPQERRARASAPLGPDGRACASSFLGTSSPVTRRPGQATDGSDASDGAGEGGRVSSGGGAERVLLHVLKSSRRAGRALAPRTVVRNRSTKRRSAGSGIRSIRGFARCFGRAVGVGRVQRRWPCARRSAGAGPLVRCPPAWKRPPVSPIPMARCRSSGPSV